MMLSPAAMVAISIFAITYICIATEKVDKTAAALLGAAIVVSLGVVPYEAALHAVDLNVVLLLVGMMVAVNVMAGTGVFEWVAVTIARKAGGRGLPILLLTLVATAVLSALLRAAGLEPHVRGPVTRTLTCGSAEAFWERFALGAPGTRALLARLGEERGRAAAGR